MDKFGEQQEILQHALNQAKGHEQYTTLAKKIRSPDAPAQDPYEVAQDWVALGNAMLAGGKVWEAESVIVRTFRVEHLHEQRWFDGAYAELGTLSAEIEAIEREAGLKPGECWEKGDGPKEHQQLSEAYEAALNARFEEALREFGLSILADLWRDDRTEYERLREVGRRSIFEKDDHISAISESIVQYEDEVVKSADSGAFYAATVMLGSAAEAKLLERFLSYPAETTTVLTSMARADKPRNADPLHWNLDQMIAVADKAGWLGVIEDEEVRVNVRLWLHSIRDKRNLLHPGRHVRDKPHAVIGSEEFLDARLGYAALCIALVKSSPSAQPA